MPNEIIRKIVYKSEYDKKSGQDVIRGASKLERSKVKALKSDRETLNLNQDIRDALLDQAKAQRDANKEAKKDLKLQKSRLDLLDEQNSTIRRQVGSIGDIDSALSAIRGGAGAIAGTDIAGLSQAAGLFELGEAVVQLKGAAPAAVESVKSLASSIGASGVGLVGAIGVLTVALAAATSEANRRAELARVIIDGQKEYFEIIKNGTTDSVTDAKKEAEETLEFARKEIETRQAQREAINEEIGAQAGFLQGVVQAGITLGITGGEVRELDNEISDLQKTILENQLAVNNYEQALKSAELAQNDATQALLSNVEGIGTRGAFVNKITKQSFEQNQNLNQSLLEQNDILASQINAIRQSGDTSEEATAALESYYEQLQKNDEQLQLLRQIGIPYTRQLAEEEKTKEEAAKRAEERAKEREQIAKQREASLNRLLALEDASNDALEDFARKQSETIQDRRLRDLRELEDFNTQVEQEQQEHQADLVEIQRDGNDRIQGLQADVSRLEGDFYSDEIEAVRTYRKDLRKLNAQYRREDATDLADHLQSLRDAEQNNDVLAFLAEQRRFEQEQKEKASQRSAEFKDLNDQFQEARRLRQQAFQERRNELQKEIQLTRQQTQEKLNAARQAFAEEQRLAEEERQRKLERQRQDDQIADQRAKQALQRQLQDINIKAQAEINAIRNVTRAVGELEMVARRIAANAGASTTTSGGRLLGYSGLKSYERSVKRLSSNATSFSTSAGTLTAFADGGIVKGGRPQLAVLGDTPRGIDEMIMPLKRGNLRDSLKDYGIFAPRGGRSGGSMVTLNFAPNLAVGDIANPSEISAALQEFATDLETQLTTAFNRAVNQSA